jgi:hypothetical protein
MKFSLEKSFDYGNEEAKKVEVLRLLNYLPLQLCPRTTNQHENKYLDHK